MSSPGKSSSASPPDSVWPKLKPIPGLKMPHDLRELLGPEHRQKLYEMAEDVRKARARAYADAHHQVIG